MTLPPSTVLAIRHLRLREALEALSLDALVITNATNIRYLTNHVGSAGVLVATREAMHLAVDFRYRESVRLLEESASACPSLRVWDVPASYDEALVQCLDDIGVTVVGFEATHLTVARHNWWRDTARGRSLAIRVSIDRTRRRAGAHGEGRVRDRRCVKARGGCRGWRRHLRGDAGGNH